MKRVLLGDHWAAREFLRTAKLKAILIVAIYDTAASRRALTLLTWLARYLRDSGEAVFAEFVDGDCGGIRARPWNFLPDRQVLRFYRHTLIKEH